MMKISSQVFRILLDHFTQDQPFFFYPRSNLGGSRWSRHVNTSECFCGNTQQLLWVLVHQNTVTTETISPHTHRNFSPDCPGGTISYVRKWGPLKGSGSSLCLLNLCVSVRLFACSCVFVFTNKLYYFLRDRMSVWPLEQAEYSRVKQWQTKTKSNLCTSTPEPDVRDRRSGDRTCWNLTRCRNNVKPPVSESQGPLGSSGFSQLWE